ncbi:hypothetical protein BLNAU_8377 [Blattamonas nauphoetae]|uniref:Uncharacterized protein n=1 Tax=Blattamonas nauphoetae TaxID=2049346 RepID=A0ABQ9XZ57_9EUKA|nr:hypothetical protein BLNAU_8377 [Blattamonas nauphoetae]
MEDFHLFKSYEERISSTAYNPLDVSRREQELIKSSTDRIKNVFTLSANPISKIHDYQTNQNYKEPSHLEPIHSTLSTAPNGLQQQQNKKTVIRLSLEGPSPTLPHLSPIVPAPKPVADISLHVPLPSAPKSRQKEPKAKQQKLRQKCSLLSFQYSSHLWVFSDQQFIGFNVKGREILLKTELDKIYGKFKKDVVKAINYIETGLSSILETAKNALNLERDVKQPKVEIAIPFSAIRKVEMKHQKSLDNASEGEIIVTRFILTLFEQSQDQITNWSTQHTNGYMLYSPHSFDEMMNNHFFKTEPIPQQFSNHPKNTITFMVLCKKDILQQYITELEDYFKDNMIPFEGAGESTYTFFRIA